MIIISQPSADQIVRISVDVWIKAVFSSLGVNAVSFSLLVVLLAGIIILYKERERLRTLNFKYFPALLAESTVYGIIVALISSALTSALLNISATNPVEELSYLQKLALSLGAGLYEELFFRVILVSLFILIFNKLFNSNNICLLSIFFARLIFISNK